MTKKQEDKLSMWTVANAVLSKHEAVWTKIKAFANAAALFRQIRLDIDPEADTQQSDKTGITQNKAQQRSDLIEECKQAALNIESYAINKKDFELEKRFQFTPTYFEKLRDNALPIAAHSIFNKAQALQKELNDYGVTPETLKELNEAILRYENINPAPQLASGNRKQATVNIAGKLKDGTVQLKLMDKMLGNFRKTNPGFVSAFKNARVVINTTIFQTDYPHIGNKIIQ